MVPRDKSFLYGTIFYIIGGNMENELLKIKEEALAKLADCSSLKELNEISRFYIW